MDDFDFSKMSDSQRLELAKEMASSIRNSLPKEIRAASFTLNSKLPFKATSFREILVHRMNDLTDAALKLYETASFVPAFVITRAILETTAMVYFLHKKSIEFIVERDEENFNNFLNRGLYGSRDGTTPMEAFNILTTVNHLEKKLENVRKIYDRLCEFTHPNYSGSTGSYSSIDQNRHIRKFGKEHQEPPMTFGLSALIACLMIFETYYNELAADLKTMNELYENSK